MEIDLPFIIQQKCFHKLLGVGNFFRRFLVWENFFFFFVYNRKNLVIEKIEGIFFFENSFPVPKISINSINISLLIGVHIM